MSTPDVGRERVRILDGIRGVAIVLVLLSHTWIVAPTVDLENPVLRVLFSSGNYAVTIFFVVSGFLATQGMLRTIDRTGSLRFGVAFVRRWIRISAHVYPLVVAVLVLTAIDSNMVAYEQNNTRESAWAIVTYTWNGYVRTHPLEARPDLGHLWYVCTDLWVIGLILVLVYLLGKRRPALLLALAAATLLVMVYRDHVYATEGLYPALTRIQTRADGLLWGAMAAVALPWLTRLRDRAPLYGALSVIALLPLMWAVNDSERYFGLAGVALNATMAVFVVATALAAPRGWVDKALGSGPVVLLGQYSLVLYVWHYPIFWYLSRNTAEWAWGWRTLVGYGATLLIGIVSQRIIERPVQRWLSSPGWRRLDDGLVPAARQALVATPGRVREAMRRPDGTAPTERDDARRD